MDDTRAHKKIQGDLEGESRREYMVALLRELQAMERMVEEGLFERGVQRIGAEQELFLVDGAYHPTPGALKIIQRLDDPHFTTELGLFNLEANADAQPFSGKGLSLMETQLKMLLEKARSAGAGIGVRPILAGILPTIDKTDLGLENMVPNPRYLTLSRAMYVARGEAFDFSIRGIDDLDMRHDSVMVEACNASFQVHIQLAEPERFAHYYNLAQFLAAPVLAVSANSPLLFNRRLWAETRIALFEQSCDVRVPGLHLRDSMGRVSFGRNWLKGGVVDVFKENVARFRPLVGATLGEEDDALKSLSEGKAPSMKALRTHNGTIYRWNRACYGISENGKPHLRIELRVLPSGPTVLDEMANAALWLGLMNELGHTIDDISTRVPFAAARANLYAAAREGVRARLQWLDGEEVLAQPLLLDKLLPLAKAGLDRAGVDPADTEKYLSVVEKRARMLKTGASWMLQSLQSMEGKGTPGSRTLAITAAMYARQTTELPVSEWELATLDERDSASTDYQKVSQLMITDFTTVRPDDPIELVQELMEWERVRYVPVEDDRGRLVGLVSLRAITRHLARSEPGASSAPVAEIMRKELVTVTPDTSTRDAVALMRKHRIGALPVVQHGHLVAMLTEEEFLGFASKVLDWQSQPPSFATGGPGAKREVGRVTGSEPGPTLIVVGGIHGNEPAGVIAGERVLSKLKNVRGDFTVLAGNVQALTKGVRYFERDLNRGWTDHHLTRLAAAGGGKLEFEDKEQQELYAAIDEAASRARGPVILADLHTSSAPGVPFVLFGRTDAQREFVKAFPIPVIGGIVETVEGVLSEYLVKRGFTTFSVEGGQHDAPSSADALEAIIWLSLAQAGIAEVRDDVKRSRDLLDAQRGDLPRVVNVAWRHSIVPADEFAMEPGFRNVDRVAKGALLARDIRGEIRAQEDGIVVLPLYQKLGSDGFFWGRESQLP
jgi:CBS domain-containing protein/succinylglutamate desuccinylase